MGSKGEHNKGEATAWATGEPQSPQHSVMVNHIRTVQKGSRESDTEGYFVVYDTLSGNCDRVLTGERVNSKRRQAGSGLSRSRGVKGLTHFFFTRQIRCSSRV
jgi:hypothetical protein